MGIATKADQRYPCPDKHLSALPHYASLVFINYRLIMLASGNCQISSDRHKPLGSTQQKNICESWIDPHAHKVISFLLFILANKLYVPALCGLSAF